MVLKRLPGERSGAEVPSSAPYLCQGGQQLCHLSPGLPAATAGPSAGVPAPLGDRASACPGTRGAAVAEGSPVRSPARGEGPQHRGLRWPGAGRAAGTRREAGPRSGPSRGAGEGTAAGRG